jgi:magnesium transporter
MNFKLTDRLEVVSSPDMLAAEDNKVAVMCVSEWQQWMRDHSMNPTPTTAYENSFVCKVEPYQDGLFGTFSVPVKFRNDERDHFACYLSKNLLVFIDDDDVSCALVQRIKLTSDQPVTCGRFFVYCLEQLIADDLRYLEELENRVAALEEKVLSDSLDSFDHRAFNQSMIGVRKELAEYHRYYAQLTDVGESLMINDNALFSPRTLGLIRLFTERISRLQSDITMLREYSMQVREVYQSLIDIRQNQIMRVLTVVTAIFLPLTLIVGWYGMNFVHMPELQWRYGYVFVIGLSLVVAAICIRIFRKKRYW